MAKVEASLLEFLKIFLYASSQLGKGTPGGRVGVARCLQPVHQPKQPQKKSWLIHLKRCSEALK